MRGSGATELAARARPHQNLYAPRSASSQSTPRTPTYQLLGLGKGDAGAQCSVKGLPTPDGLGSFRGARRSTRARDQAWGPTERRRTPERTIRPVRLRHPTAHVGVCLWPARCHRIAAASPLTCVGHRIRSL